MAQTYKFTRRATNQQAPLISQNLRAWEEEQTPSLRLSQNMDDTTMSRLSSAEAKQVWEGLQLTADELIAQSAQLREANIKADAATRQARTLQTELVQLKTQLQEHQATAWQQPAVYAAGAAGAAVLGLGFLWLSERKKKIAAQEHLLAMTDDLRSGLGMSLGPSINFAESSLPPAEFTPCPPKQAKLSTASLKAQSGHDPLTEALSRQDAEMRAIASSASWWKRIKRSSDTTAVTSASGYESSAAYTSTQVMVQSAEIDVYENSTELQDMQAPVQDYYDPTRANVELLSQTRIKPASGDDAMGHLLEIRMAVQSLCVLGHPVAAQTLLYRHIEAVPNTCAWAYMEYLDVCAQLNQRDAFEAMRKRYRLQFNRLAPYWMEPNASVQTLDTYERPMLELSIAWSSKDEAKSVIATWLLGNLHSRRLFQLPAYHDLLDLYEMLEFYEAEPPPADWVPTVSLLDLDYEFAIDVKIEAQSEHDALRSIPAVKTGDFAVDFNVAGTSQPGTLTPLPYIPSATTKPGTR